MNIGVMSEDSNEDLLKAEVNQLKIRLGITLLMILSVLALNQWQFAAGPHFTAFDLLVVSACLEFLVILGIMFWIFRAQGARYSPPRVVFGQIFDFFNISLGFFCMGDQALLFYPIYLWVILGNGMRFGLKLLTSSAVLAMVGFSTVMILAPYWRDHIQVGVGFLIGLGVLPFYFGLLIKRINETRDLLINQEKSKVELLKQMDDLKTNFFANISHEFRTPIALTLGVLDAIEKDNLDPSRLQKQSEVMKRNQMRLLDLINQILDLEKMEKGKFTLKIQPLFDLNGFLNRRAEQFRAMAQRKNIDLKIDFDPKLSKEVLYTDASNLDKVIFNLLSNAFKFTNKGQVQIASRRGSNEIIISVSDTGTGIREDQIAYIFDRFRQATGSESKDYSGTGIGLALVQEIVNLHNGKIEVESVFGKGTTFRVHLPLGKSHFSPDLINETPFSEGNEMVGQHALIQEGLADTSGIEIHRSYNFEVEKNKDDSKKTVLFVDDNFDLREFMKDLLSTEFNLFLATNGEEGFEMASDIMPDLIISDLMMPKLDGIGFLRKIRHRRQFDETPFVILTAKSSDEFKFDALESGADDFLNKPFTRSEVQVRVRNLLKLRESSRRVRDDLRAARAIQFSLLPELPAQKDKAQIDVLYKPCADLSGDFFDFEMLGDSIYGYVADVTSHGTSSAQVTYIVKSIFKEAFSKYKDSISVSNLLADFARKYVDYNLDYGVGIQLFKLNLRDMNLSYSSTNAPSALMITNDESKQVRVNATAIIDAKMYRGNGFEFEETSVPMMHGSSFFCFTDGCLELPTAAGQFGERRLARELKTLYDRPDWKENLQQTFDSMLDGRHFEDDMTILRIQC